MNKAVLVLGATSPIARAAAYELAAKGHSLFLAGRDETELHRLTQDCRIRFNVDVKSGCFDADSCKGHDLFIQYVVKQMGGLEGVVAAFGYHGNKERAIKDFDEAEKILLRNFVGACSLLTACANVLETQGHGFVVGISSIAADRGRQSDYVFGAAKAGLTIFLQGLRNRLFHAGVHVLTVKLGPVDTAATFGEEGLLWLSPPVKVGKKIISALNGGKNEVYLPWQWRISASLLRRLPEWIFKRLKL